MREIRYGIRSVYFRTGVKDVLARFATLEEDGGAPERGRGVQQHATYSILLESFMVNTGDL